MATSEALPMEVTPYQVDEQATRPKASAARRTLWWFLRAAVSVGVLSWLIGGLEWAAITEIFARVHVSFFLAALGLYGLAQVVSSYRWRLLAAPLGFQASLGRYVALYFIGMFFNLFLPTSVGGDVARAWYLSPAYSPSSLTERRKKSAVWLAALSVLGDRVFGLIALMLIACAATIPNYDVFPGWILAVVWGATATGAVGLTLLPTLARWHKGSRVLTEGLSLYRNQHRRWATVLLLSFVVQAASIVEVLWLGLALDLPASVFAYAVAVPLVSLLTLLPISVNGLGVREGSLVLLLAPAGVSSAQALALGLLWFCMSVSAGAMGGGVYLASRSTGSQNSDSCKEQSDGPIDRHSPQGRERQPAAAA